MARRPETRQQAIERHVPEYAKHVHNLITLLKYSNVTPFKERNALGYVCAYCPKIFPDPTDLRTHTRTVHSKHRLSYKNMKNLNNYSACLDIEDLKCALCCASVQDLTELAKHLQDSHEKKYYWDIDSYFQPFLLTAEQEVRCCICKDYFDDMKKLMHHMNSHFRNFICPSCGSGFLNKQRLLSHEATHLNKKMTYPCRFCSQTFKYETRRKVHVNSVHKKIDGNNLCQICKSRFKNYYQKARHMIEAHNAETLKCDKCEKRFAIRSSLLIHYRRDHMQERDYECEVCKMRFFCRKRMLEHMVVHTGVKEYSCEVCGKAFARTKNLKTHMKTHENDVNKS